MFGILVFILILSFLIFIHELGHFLAAKRSGVVVEEFGIGYPPKAVKLFTWQGTDFTLNWIPFGGFVRMSGEMEGFQEVHTKEEREEFKKKKKGKFYGASTSNKLMIILAGATFNFIFGVIAFTLVFAKIGIPEPIDTARIGRVMPNTPASEAGLPENVEILEIEVEGQRYSANTVEEAIDVISDNTGKNAVVYTTGPCEGFACAESLGTYEVYFRPKEEVPAGEGSLGIEFQPAAFVRYPWWQMPIKSGIYGLKQSLFLGREILAAFSTMLGGLVFRGDVPADIAGPIGIVHQAQTTGLLSEGWPEVLAFAALLSINLAILNVLPIPPLDGGRAVFIILERLINEKFAKPLEYYMNYGGYLMLVLLIILITARDIWRLFH